MLRPRPVLAFDARANITGLGRYTEQLLPSLRSALPGTELWCIAHPSHEHKFSPHVDRVIPSTAAMYSIAGQTSIPGLIRGATLLHCPHYDVPALYPDRMSVTIHDATHILDPAFRHMWKSRIFARTLLRIAVVKALRIITISEYSKRMIMEHLGGKEDRISIIHRYASPEFTPMPSDQAKETVRSKLDITGRFFLFVGLPKPHKNLPVLFEAFALLLARNNPAVQLVIIGRDRKNEPGLRALATHLGIDRSLRWFDTVSDQVLRACYSAAEATILPSRQEGFGLPVIESMACGTPVICANAASLPEIAGGCSLLFDPSSPEECSAQMLRLLESLNLRDQLREKGLCHARKFDPAHALAQHAQFFSELLAG